MFKKIIYNDKETNYDEFDINLMINVLLNFIYQIKQIQICTKD